jgi:hypothetical protein
MYLLDPQGGHDRRALAREKSLSVLKQGSRAAARTTRQLGGKSKELVSEAGARLRRSDLVDNGADLLKKVQRKIQHAVSHPQAIEAIIEQGRVHLHGLVLASEVARLLAAIQAVEGVREIENRLEVHESPQDLAAYRKGARRWVEPAARVLTGATGSALALAAVKRKDPLGVALGAVGLGLLAHGLANPDVKGLAGRIRLARNGHSREGLAELQSPAPQPKKTARTKLLSTFGRQRQIAYQP